MIQSNVLAIGKMQINGFFSWSWNCRQIQGWLPYALFQPNFLSSLSSIVVMGTFIVHVYMECAHSLLQWHHFLTVISMHMNTYKTAFHLLIVCLTWPMYHPKKYFNFFFSVFCVVFCRSFFVLFLLTILLSFDLWLRFLFWCLQISNLKL